MSVDQPDPQPAEVTSEAPAAPGAADGASAWDRSRGRRISVRALLVLAVVLGVLSIFSVWTRQQLLDTNQWTKTSTQLLENKPIRDQVSLYLVDQLYSNVDITGELQSRLPKQFAPLAPAAASGLRNLIQQGTDKALTTPAVQNGWEEANRAASKILVKIVDGGGTNVSTNNGTVTLTLGPILAKVAARIGIPQGLIDKIPPDAANIQVLKSDQLSTAQDGAKLLKALALVLGPLAFLSLILAVYLAGGHRRQTLFAAGFAAVTAGLIVLLARTIIGNQVTSALAPQASVRPAANAAWTIATDLLKVLGWQAIVVGLAIILAAWAAGPSKIATRMRRALAPGLRDRPEIAYGIAAAFVLLLVVWSPLPGLHRPFFILLLIILVPLGVWALRRQTEEEFPPGAEAAAVEPPAASA